jgi:hypothetical protein
LQFISGQLCGCGNLLTKALCLVPDVVWEEISKTLGFFMSQFIKTFKGRAQESPK